MIKGAVTLAKFWQNIAGIKGPLSILSSVAVYETDQSAWKNLSPSHEISDRKDYYSNDWILHTKICQTMM